MDQKIQDKKEAIFNVYLAAYVSTVFNEKPAPKVSPQLTAVEHATASAMGVNHGLNAKDCAPRALSDFWQLFEQKLGRTTPAVGTEALVPKDVS